MAVQSNFPAVEPNLLLDFANTRRLDPRITFVRTTTATYYDGTTSAKAEENLLLRSQEFDNAYWYPTNATVTANSTTAPDGTSTADTLADDATNSTHRISLTTSGVSGSTYVFSVFAKANTRSILWMNLYDTVNKIAWFDLSAGTVGTVQAGVTASIVSVGNGWYRCITIRTANAGTFYPLIGVSNADNVQTYTGNGSSIYIWGAQLEQRSSATAYTATTTQAITNYIPVLQTAAAGVARFDHNPTTDESLGLLVEEARTNLLTYSADFTNAAWTKLSSVSASANTMVAPDGFINADTVTADSGFSIYQNTVSVIGTTYCQSVYIKAGTATAIMFRDDTGAGRHIVLNPATGTITTTSGTLVSSGSQAVGNGWWRYWFAYAADTTLIRILIRPHSAGSAQTFIVWGAQTEVGAFPTSYIPTVASTVTRNADAASMTGSNFTSWFNAAEGTFYIDLRKNGNLFAQQGLNLNDNSTSTQIAYGFGSGVNPFRLDITYGGSSVASLVGISNTTTLGVNLKLAGGYKTNDFAVSGNGGSVATDTSGNVPVVTQMGIGYRNTSTPLTITGTIAKIAYYPVRISNANLQALTS